MSYDSDVVSATGGVGEADWDKIIKLCNRIRDSVGPTSMHQAMQSVMKRVKHGNPAVQIHALTLLEACVSNCGVDFQKELVTTFFQNDVKGILLGRYTDARVAQRLKELLLSWSSEFKSAPHMKELHKFLEQLRRDGVTFSAPAPQTSALSSSVSPSPAAQSSQAREEDDLRKAIQLSLQDKSNPPSSSISSSLSPSPTPAKKESQARKVRAIYDFQAAEDNELSFRAGEIVTLLDDSDENWWRGETQLGQGLFPASFVSKNLNKDPEPSKQEKKKAKNKTKTDVAAAKVTRSNVGGAGGVVNEQKVDLLLDMLKSADVTDTSKEESKTVKELEREVQGMRSVVERSLQLLSVREEAMQTVSSQFNEALDLYRKLLAEGPRLSDVAPATAAQSYSHTGQHGMATHDSHSVVNQVPPPAQSGMGTHPFHQNGPGTQPQHTGMQPQATFHTSIPPQHGMGTHAQYGMGTQLQHGMPVQQSGMATQGLTGAVIQQNGMTAPPQTGMGTDHQSRVYSTNPPVQYTAAHDVSGGELSLHPPPSLQYQPMTSLPPQQHHSSYASPLYQPVVSMTTQLPLSSTSSFPTPPTYHPTPPHSSQMFPQPLP